MLHRNRAVLSVPTAYGSRCSMLDDIHELWLHYGVLPATDRPVCALHIHEHACADDDDRRAVY